jgi:hypothetical protein
MTKQMSSLITNVLIDLVILASFLIAFEPTLTGIPIHEWLSLALTGVLIAHILLHWQWVVSVTVHFVRQLLHSSRLNYVVDALIFIAMVTVMFSGILISRSILDVLGIPPLSDPFWRILHARSADATLILTACHFALHWKWVVNTFKRFVIAPIIAFIARPLAGQRQARAEE